MIFPPTGFGLKTSLSVSNARNFYSLKRNEDNVYVSIKVKMNIKWVEYLLGYKMLYLINTPWIKTTKFSYYVLGGLKQLQQILNYTYNHFYAFYFAISTDYFVSF